MKTVKLCQWSMALALMLAALPVAALSEPPELGDSIQPTGVESLAGSFVYLDPPSGGDECFVSNRVQDFCFNAVSITDDWEYVYYLWMRFPTGWRIQDISVLGTPFCMNGGIFEDFSWTYLDDYEVRIDHTRYHANPSDRCEATYCFHVTSGSATPGLDFALVSWYWTGDGSGDPPHYPCSSDGYTPLQQPACDDASAAAAGISKCPSVYAYLPIVLRSDP